MAALQIKNLNVFLTVQQAIFKLFRIVILNGMTGALAPFSHIVLINCIKINIISLSNYLKIEGQLV
jgi:hypothetical protein